MVMEELLLCGSIGFVFDGPFVILFGNEFGDDSVQLDLFVPGVYVPG